MPVYLRIIIYPLFGFVCFAIFFIFLFPFASIKGRIQTEAERALGNQYRVQIGEVSLVPMTGIGLSKVVISEKAGEQRKMMVLDKGKMHFSLLPFLWGALSMGYDLESAGGRVFGRLEQSDSQINLEADLRDVNLVALPFIKAKWGVDLSSDVDGKIDMELYPKTPIRNNGSIQLNIQKLKMGESNIMKFFKLPPLDLAAPQGKSRVDIVMNRGNIEIRSLDLKGGEITLSLGGKIYLAQRVSHFRLNIRGKFGIDEKRAKDFVLLSVIGKQKGEDGLYPLTVTGQIRRPNIRIGEFRVPI